MKVLQLQNRRLKHRIEGFKDLLEHLYKARLISEEAHAEMIVRTNINLSMNTSN